MASSGLTAANLSSIQSLTRLTSLALLVFDLEVSTSSTLGWSSSLTALESLALGCCDVQPAALAAFTQLRALSLIAVYTMPTPQGDGVPESYDELLRAVSNLPQLTKLCYLDDSGMLRHASATAYTALTASTGLCSLQLALVERETPEEDILFRAGVVHPHLTCIKLEHAAGQYVEPHYWDSQLALNQHQLQHMCSCCPALESLACMIPGDLSPAALQPMLQLSALTHLQVTQLHLQEQATAAAAANLVALAAQLTQLKQLTLLCLRTPAMTLTDPAVLQLTALTALESLSLSSDGHGDNLYIYMQNKVGF
jgi:hypothetical protein